MIVFVNSHLRHFLSIEPLISQIKARQVVFLNRDDHQKQLMSSKSSYKMENWIYSRFASWLPSTWIDMDMDDMPESLQKSNSLFLYVGVEQNFDKNFVKNLKGLTLNFPVPIRVLLIIIKRNNDSSARYLDLLKLFWQEQLVDVTIIGISSRVTQYRRKIAIVNHEKDYAATIHHYNPFTNVYTNRTLDSSSRLFPTKLDDLNGHGLRVGFIKHRPYTLSKQKSKEHMGIFDSVLDLIESKMNFSIESDFIMNYPMLQVDSFERPIIQMVSKRRLDVLVFGSHLIHTEDPHSLDRTTFITSDRICGLVPLIIKPTFQLSRSIQWSLLLILCLVSVVWLSSLLLLRRDGGHNASSSLKSYWRPLDIGLMMMGASILARAVTLRERLLFGCVLMVGLFYSSTIVAQLTSMNLDLKAHKKFETYRELEESGLIPFIKPHGFKMSFGYSDDPSLRRCI
ncbi:unnamed protein product [Trichogramma brassicae]|uniref:Ionotropic glutamate receptor C-terminal domain-containing protein n=1 Tax=Trichogramma brassicae TaxID=86971 RepID=A0A6H5HWA0_9HYME|nr:unnamed protein product [Trichogramma brassicae]